jgi:dihydrofolate synthase/folylpolyglutamate synthase
MNYEEALKYIYSFADLERGVGFSDRSPAKYRFQRVEHLLDELGNPHRRLRFAHVAGSNGKGSTAAMLGSIAAAAGMRVGLYTQPHLHTFRERIMVDSMPIAPEAFASLMERVGGAVSRCVDRYPEEGDPTTFEIATVAAFDHFVEAGVNLAVIEVGLGGTWDATNVIDPAVSIITSLSLEHRAILGDTLGEIAGEKAGIIKPGRPVVTVPQPPDAMSVIERRARELGAPLRVVGPGSELCMESDDGIELSNGRPLLGCCLLMAGESYDVSLPLLGDHQLLNAAAAVGAARELALSGSNIKVEHIIRGLEDTAWPARFETLQQNPLLVVDGAHTPDACLRVRDALVRMGAGDIHLVFGAGADKDALSMLHVFALMVAGVYLCASDHPRAARAAALLETAAGLDLPAREFDSVREALAAAESGAGDDETILVTGSIFVAAEAREAKGLAGELDPPILSGKIPAR